MQKNLPRLGAIFGATFLASLPCLLLLLGLGQLASASPNGRRCGEAGPLDEPPPDYCGCTVGNVLFRGQPIAGARVTLTFGAATTTTITRPDTVFADPYYSLEGFKIGLRLNHIATVTAEYDGQIVTRTYRARPDDTTYYEQEINLVIPDVGRWRPEPSAGYTLALKVIGNEIWMGGLAGLQRRALTGTVLITEPTGLSSGVAALTTDASGRVWALGNTSQIAVRTGNTWATMDSGLTGTQRAIVLARDNSLWAGGDGGLSRNDGTSWQPQPDFNGELPNQVMALHRASDGSLWVATWEGGVAQLTASNTWVTYTTANSGLNSNRVGGIAETSAGIWFALDDYVEPPRRYGGLSVYSPTLNAWQTYTQAHGLPLLDTRSVAGSANALWVSTLGGGLARAIDSSHPLTFTVYVTEDGLSSNVTSRLAISGEHVFVATMAGVDRLEPSLLGTMPTVTFTHAPPLSVTDSMSLYLAAAGSDADSDPNEVGRIMGYEWTSHLDGPLCSLITCTLAAPMQMMRLGAHTLRLRVLDDEGAWSDAVTAQVMIGRRVFLPFVS